jgi:uncharacterized protein YdaU (DUF1376 family)
MNKPPAFQFYASDFYVDTNSWTCTEVGLYMRLLMSEWVNGPLPNDTERLARASGMDHGNFKKLWCPLVKGKFVENGNGTLINLRLERVRENQSKYRESQAEKGRHSAKKRWGGKVTGVITGVITTVTERLQPECNSSSSSSSSSSLKNKNITQLFEKFWSIYPSRNGRKVTKKESLQFFKDNFKNEEGINLLLRATENYSKSDDAQRGFAKDPIRFLKKDFWRDWIEKEVQDDPYSDFPRIGGKGGP